MEHHRIAQKPVIRNAFMVKKGKTLTILAQFVVTAPEVGFPFRTLEDEMLQSSPECSRRRERPEKGVRDHEGGKARGYRQKNPDEGPNLEDAADEHDQDGNTVLREAGDVFPYALIRVVHLAQHNTVGNYLFAMFLCRTHCMRLDGRGGSLRDEAFFEYTSTV